MSCVKAPWRNYVRACLETNTESGVHKSGGLDLRNEKEGRIVSCNEKGSSPVTECRCRPRFSWPSLL